jgi:hypothetical protein
MQWKVGSAVEFDLVSDLVEAEEAEAKAIGIVGKIEGDTAYVVEVHAFHRLWGGSNVCRGHVVEAPLARLDACRPNWRHIIEENKNKSQVRNSLDELLAPAHP